MTDNHPKSDVQNVVPVRKEPYTKPSFHRIGADEAETGIQFGPEILILLS
ncbi:MAG: hypothetical protein WDM91_00060 [Rhizomicrobium sp.]